MRQNALNARLPPSGVDVYCIPNESAQVFARQALKKLGLSARSYHRVLKMARTIADLAQEEDISTGHLSEAIQYRRLAFDNPLQ
jgi:magnesium chelatase family protein